MKDSNYKFNSRFSFRSSFRSCSISRFPIPRISAHRSSKSISNRFFQHFRYIGSKKKQQFFEKSHQEYRFTLEIWLKQQFRRRNERKQRFYRIREAYTIFEIPVLFLLQIILIQGNLFQGSWLILQVHFQQIQTLQKLQRYNRAITGL